MANYLRNNAWNEGGDFHNPDLLWYAQGVGAMMSRALNDPTSWWFYAAIHGEYVNPATAWYPQPAAFPAWSFITSPPSVPTAPLPSQATQELYWNQCQHNTWYFLPWHRGYLLALETQLRKDIVSLGGPATWALPYWNYFGGKDGGQYVMPPAFGEKILPDGSANPLYVAMRYGPDLDGNIYIPTPAGAAAHPGDPHYHRGLATENVLANDLFTGTDTITPLPGFGGPDTGFSHGGGTFGNLESNPHNLIHVYVGGIISETDADYGVMADPGTAALDPIFYLHHSNIDRMWAVWNTNGNANPTAPGWLDGPAQQFAMPTPDGQPWYYTPAEMANLSALDYSYQELADQPVPAAPVLAERLALLGAPVAANEPAAKATPKQPELLGASAGSFSLRGRGTQTAVRLDTSEQRKTVASLTNASITALPDRIFLKLENVRGTSDATVLGVYVHPTADAQPDEDEQFLAGNVALFGLRRASVPDGQHGGEGLTFIVDITHIVDQLHLTNTLNSDSLQVSLVPDRPLPAAADIQVGRISIYRQAF